MSSKRALYFFFLFFLSWPYIFLCTYLYSDFATISASIYSLDWFEFFWALKNSVLQASLSAFMAVINGALLCFGKFKLESLFSTKRVGFNIRGLIDLVLILPSLLPALFSILCIVNVISPFPTGIIGVSIIHAFMNAGLVSLYFDQMIRTKLAGTLEISYVEGASKAFYLRTIFSWVFRDLLGIFLFVFILCFTSFSVPLLAGGGRATTLEILIFEKIKITGDLSQGVILSILQLAIVSLLSFIPLTRLKRDHKASPNCNLFHSNIGLFVLLLTLFLPIFFFVKESILGWQQVFAIPNLVSEIAGVIADSVLFSIITGFVAGVLLLALAWAGVHVALFRMISAFIAPSTSLLGLALVLVLLKLSGSDNSILMWVLWSIGFCYIILPTVFRWGWHQELMSLQSQICVAQLMGAKNYQIFSQIVLPQVSKPLAMLSGIAAMWALGDFSLGKFLSGSAITLALLIESLLNAYRIQAALALMGLLLCIGLIIWAFFQFLEMLYQRQFRRSQLME